MIIVRAEGNSIIGLGHLMRTMSIASHLKDYDELVYLCAGSDSIKLIGESGFDVVSLVGEAFSIDEARAICDMDYPEDTLILLDSYQVSDDYIELLTRKYVVAYMDDLIEHPYPADIVINYNSYATNEEYVSLYQRKKLRVPRLITGSKYIPLRDEFKRISDQGRDGYDLDANKSTIKILITTGGGDYDNYAGRIAHGILKYVDLDIELHVVCGPVNPNYPMLLELSNADKRLTIHRAVKNMAELMKCSDMAISAGGSTCYELCAMEVPFVVFAYADNQVRILDSLSEAGAALYAGYADTQSKADEVIATIVGKVITLMEDKELRDKLTVGCTKITDAVGAMRLAEALFRLKTQ